jgi:hypothetical protein
VFERRDAVHSDREKKRHTEIVRDAILFWLGPIQRPAVVLGIQGLHIKQRVVAQRLDQSQEALHSEVEVQQRPNGQRMLVVVLRQRSRSSLKRLRELIGHASRTA